MHQQPYYNPKLPFKGSIKGGLHEGKSITLTGRVLPGAERFNVDLQCDSGIVLHFNPRYEALSYVVCNTLQGSAWGKEERKHPSPFPLGANFTLTFLVNHDSYSIVANGAHFMEYKHRISATRVDQILVNGGVEIHSIAFQNAGSSYPGQPCHSNPRSFRGQKQPRSQKGFAAHSSPFCMAPPPNFNPPPYSPPQSYILPYKAVIQGGMYPGKNITIQGIPNQQAERFHINLCCNTGIALHFNPRFRESTVVRNSHLSNKWGSEERSGGMPFQLGQPFTVMFVCDTQCYRIIVNGIQMFTYNHRHFNHQHTDIVEVGGDLTLSSVQV